MRKIKYNGRYVSGTGERRWMELIDKSAEVLHASPRLPGIAMLYKAEFDHFVEGFIWGNGWWIQNSYGFTLGAIPQLSPLWAEKLQQSYDLFWDRIGDGKRSGRDDGKKFPGIHHLNYVAPDGSLGDCADNERIVYKQGDCRHDLHDWFYEGTAAGVVMQCELLLFSRDKKAAKKYIPLMRRSLDHVEETRDPKNDLFLVGPGSNLLAPSYGGSFDKETGEIGKGYLTGLSVTMSAALRRYIAVLEMVGEGESKEAASRREMLDRTVKSLKKFLVRETGSGKDKTGGYYVKSMDPDGTLHGVYGQGLYGYLEAVCNVDAIAVGDAEYSRGERILKTIESCPNIRTAGPICNNFPPLDDTYFNYLNGTHFPDSFGFLSGDWVDGGCWATVEGRALLAYFKHGRYDDAFRAADWYMKWNEEYRMDEPLSQWGQNTNNPWSNESYDHTVCERPVAVMVDNFAASTCLIRGLLGLKAGADALWVTPHIPAAVKNIELSSPIYYAGAEITVSMINGKKPLRAFLNGKELSLTHFDDEAKKSLSAVLPAEALEAGKKYTLVLDLSGEADPAKQVEKISAMTELSEKSVLPKEIEEIRIACEAACEKAAKKQNCEKYTAVLEEIAAYSARLALPFNVCKLRPMNKARKAGILALYEITIKELWANANRQ